MSSYNSTGFLDWLLQFVQNLFQNPMSSAKKPAPSPKPQQYTPPTLQPVTPPPAPKPVTPAPKPRPVTPPSAEPQPGTKVEKHRVAGISFRLDAIESLGVYNADYDKSQRELIEDGLLGECIYRTDYFANVTTLEPEPDNPEDPKAIKVVVDGVHIGYIKAGSCAHIHKVMREGRLENVRCEIYGGPYKILQGYFGEYYVDEDGLNDPTYRLVRDTSLYYAELYITVKTTK